MHEKNMNREWRSDLAVSFETAATEEKTANEAMQAKVRSVFACLSIAVHFDATEL